MLKAIGIAATDGLNRKNHFIVTRTLLNAYRDAWKYGVPSNIGHDSTRFIGWTFFSGIYFEPGKAFVTNHFYQAENDKDMKILKEHSSVYHQIRCIEERREEYDYLKSLLDKNLYETGHIAPMYSAVAVEDKNIVLRVIPELSDLIIDGLVALENLRPIFPGVYEFGEYVVFAHRQFRRSGSLMNNLNREFLEKYEKIDPVLNPRIALDLDVIGLKKSVTDEVEYAFWWGPKFSDNLSDIKEGVTRHGNNHYNELFNNIQYTDFYWHTQDDAKTFECEELNCRSIITEQGESYDCRYVHSRLDDQGESVIHLDGAIRSYNVDQMIYRMDQNLDVVKKDSNYKKLWRIDGDISIVKWKELITHYFRDNILVGEYLGGEDEKYNQIVIEDRKEKALPVPAKKYLPNDMESGNGLRFFFCYKNADERRRKTEYDVTVDSTQMISLDEGDTFKPFIEFETITLLKLIKRNGLSVRIPYTIRIAHEDMIFNFPVIYCNSVSSASVIFKSFFQLFKVFTNHRDDRLISFSIRVEAYEEENDILISFAGHVNDFCEVFEELGTEFPERDAFDDWLLRLNDINTKRTTVANENIKVYDLLKSNGILMFDRALVPTEYLNNIECNNSRLYCSFSVTEDVMKEITSLHLGIAPAFYVRSSKCKKCGREYISCDCIKFFENVEEQITDFIPAGAYWTNRHARDLYLKIDNKRIIKKG